MEACYPAPAMLPAEGADSTAAACDSPNNTSGVFEQPEEPGGSDGDRSVTTTTARAAVLVSKEGAEFLVSDVSRSAAITEMLDAELASYHAAGGAAPRGTFQVHLPFSTDSVRRAAAMLEQPASQVSAVESQGPRPQWQMPLQPPPQPPQPQHETLLSQDRTNALVNPIASTDVAFAAAGGKKRKAREAGGERPANAQQWPRKEPTAAAGGVARSGGPRGAESDASARTGIIAPAASAQAQGCWECGLPLVKQLLADDGRPAARYSELSDPAVFTSGNQNGIAKRLHGKRFDSVHKTTIENCLTKDHHRYKLHKNDRAQYCGLHRFVVHKWPGTPMRLLCDCYRSRCTNVGRIWACPTHGCLRADSTAAVCGKWDMSMDRQRADIQETMRAAARRARLAAGPATSGTIDD